MALSLVYAACSPATDSAPLNSTRSAAGAVAPAGAAGSLAPGGAGRGPVPVTVAAGSGSLPALGAAAGSGATMAPNPGSALPRAGAIAVAMAGRGPITGAAGAGVAGALAPAAGASAGGAAGGGASTGGACGDGTATDGRPTTGPLACIVEQHNAVRAMVKSATPLPPVTWDAEIAKYAQEWTDMTCMNPMHRSKPALNGKLLGENLYASGGRGDTAPGKHAVDGWAGEVACYTYGTFMTADKCDMQCTTKMNSDGCGHYTQVVWRASVKIGCGVTSCSNGTRTEVICNYAPAGNFVGMNPY